MVPVVIVRAAGGSEADLAWMLFAAMAICGITTAMQALRIGRFGSGYVAVMGTSLAVVGVGVTAVAEGGLPLLATLVLVASVVPLVLSVRLTLLRKILTPTVSGTVIMLIPATLMPSAFDLLSDVPSDTPVSAAPLCAAAALFAIIVATLKGSAGVRLWAPVIVCGSGVRGRPPLRSLQRRGRHGGIVDRLSFRGLARSRPGFRSRVPGTSARVRACRSDRERADDQQRPWRFSAPRGADRERWTIGRCRARSRRQASATWCAALPARSRTRCFRPAWR